MPERPRFSPVLRCLLPTNKEGRFLIGDAPPQTAPSTARRSTRPRLWAEIGTEEWSDVDLERAVALLPIGAIEQHGPHLPCGVDTYQLEGVVASALGRLEEEHGSAQVLTLPDNSSCLVSLSVSLRSSSSLSFRI